MLVSSPACATHAKARPARELPQQRESTSCRWATLLDFLQKEEATEYQEKGSRIGCEVLGGEDGEMEGRGMV